MVIIIMVCIIIILLLIMVKMGMYIFKVKKENSELRLEINRVDMEEHERIQKQLQEDLKQDKSWLNRIKRITAREGLNKIDEE